MNLDAYEALALSRRATRHFKSDPVSEALLERILSITRWAPSGYNLQPTHFVLVTDQKVREKLHPACLKQTQILEAPAVVVFTGDRLVVEHNFRQILAQEREAKVIDAQYEKVLNHFIHIAFDQGPLGVGWLGKFLAAPLLRYLQPMPSIPAVEKKYWLAKQVMLAAMNFMLAARAGGLATVPMEGFDEARVRQVLKIPKSHVIPVVIPVGYAADPIPKKTRLPLEHVLHKNHW